MTNARGVNFTFEDAQRAAYGWGANCGPGAIAAALHLTLDQLRPHLGDFERKGYTSPSMMFAVLRRLGVAYATRVGRVSWPDYGLVRVQWEGPWMAPGVPMAARYRHTHWVASRRVVDVEQIFDINAMVVGGWIALAEWAGDLVPWLLRQCERKADGRWHLTHALEIAPAEALSCRSRVEAASCR